MDYHLDGKLYNSILNRLEGQFSTEIVGTKTDMNFLINDRWMRDTAVVENIIHRNGLWRIFLIFAHYKNPMLLIRREISVCFRKDRAVIYAQYMRRIAAKDPRGTLEVDINHFTIPTN